MTLPFRTDPGAPPPATDTRPPQRKTPATGPVTGPVHDARALTGPDQTGHILLDGKLYTLRITRAGKLILTK